MSCLPTEFNEVSTDGLETVLGGPYTTAQINAMGVKTSEVAFNNAKGCGSCHDALRTSGELAFPHGYVNAEGAPAPKWSNRLEPGAIMDLDGYLQTSFLWMTIAEDADGAKALMRTKGVTSIDANVDGACLKCHLSGDQAQGVGKTY